LKTAKCWKLIMKLQGIYAAIRLRAAIGFRAGTAYPAATYANYFRLSEAKKAASKRWC